jgi:hypothetical protein
MKQVFEARLEGRGPSGYWVFLPIPFSVEKTFGSKSRVPVCGTINGYCFRNSLMPEGGGSHSMMVNKALQVGASVSKGDRVSVVMDVDRRERKVDVPADLRLALRREPKANQFFEQLSYSRKKEYADWILGAKRPETRSARVSRAVGLLKAGKRQR